MLENSGRPLEALQVVSCFAPGLFPNSRVNLNVGKSHIRADVMDWGEAALYPKRKKKKNETHKVDP